MTIWNIEASPRIGGVLARTAISSRKALEGRGFLWLLLLTAPTLFVLGYWPSQKQEVALRKDLNLVRARVTRLRARIWLLQAKRDALAAGDSEAVQDAIRETLLKGKPGEGILPE